MLHKNVRWLSLFNFLLDFRPYYPIAILYFAQVSGSYTLGMTVFSTVMLVAALFEIPTGLFSDMIGRRKTLILGSLASFVSVLFYAIGGVFSMLMVGAVFEGLARSLYSGNNDALLHDSLKEKGQESEYAEFSGRLSAMFQIGTAFAAVLGSVLANWSYAWVMWVSLVPAFWGVLVSLKMVEPKTVIEKSDNVFVHLKEAVGYFRTNRRLRLLSIAQILYYALDETAYQFKAAFIVTVWPVWAIGFGKVFGNAGAAIGFTYAGRWIKKWGEGKILVFRAVYSHVMRFLALGFPTVASPVMISTNSVSWAAGTVAEGALLQKEFSDKQRSTMGSLNSLAGSLGYAVVGMVLGMFADALGPVKALLILEVCKLPLLGVYWKVFKKK